MYKMLRFTGIVLFVIVLSCKMEHRKTNYDYVNVFIGTADSNRPSLWESNGGTYPGAAVPFGMVHATPDGYKYDVLKIHAFSVLGQISGYPKGSSGRFRIMPFVGDFKNEASISSHYKHSNEKASPGYYSVFLDSHNVQAEMTVTRRNSFFKFGFPQNEKKSILISDIDAVKVLDNQTITGKSSGHYFVLRINEKENDIEVFDNRIVIHNSNIENKDIMIKVGFSSTSLQNAIRNQEKELNGWNFNQTKEDAKDLWNSYLNLIEVEDESENNKAIFYSALYHSFLDPCLISDFGEEDRYANLSPWDTYHTKLPLITFLRPDVQRNMIKSVLDVFDEKGRMEPGPMTGDHNVPAILDAYRKGIEIDKEKAYKAMRASLMEPPYARQDMAYFIENEFVSSKHSYSVTKTLEYAYDYWAMGEMAKDLGATEDYSVLRKKSYAYNSIYNPDTKFMTAKKDDGSWDRGGYREGDKWAYNWSATHDVQGLINLNGGKESFVKLLEKSFENEHYYHDNEPPMHNAYLFSYAGKPWKTQKWVSAVRQLNYSILPGGLPGNDDLGALSSWYVFSAMGFYPVSPGRPEYVIGTPQFDKLKIDLSNNKKLIIETKGKSDENVYIQSILYNNEPYSKLYFDHSKLANGGHIVFNMGPKPIKTKVLDSKLLPKSMTVSVPQVLITSWGVKQKKVVADEPIHIDVRLFNDSKASGTKDIKIFVDDKLYMTKGVFLSPGQTVVKKLQIRLYEPGIHKLSLNGFDALEINVESGAPATFKYSEFELPVPSIASTDSIFTASARIKNIGNYSGVEKVSLMVNGQKVETKEVLIDPGQSIKVSFKHRIKNPALYKVNIGPFIEKPLLIYNENLKRQPNRSFVFAPIVDLNFNEEEANMESKSGFRIHGNVKFVKGIFGNAIQTNALENNYIEILNQNDHKAINEGKESTIMLWVHPIDETNFSDIISYGDVNVIQVRASNTEVNYYAGGWQRGEAYSKLPSEWNKRWHHIAGVSTNTSLKLYIDGKLLTEKPIDDVRGALAKTINSVWNIGRNVENTERHFNGYIDEVKIFDKPLSHKEILYHMFDVKM